MAITRSALIVYGRSQMGKSSTILKLMSSQGNVNQPSVSKGKGKSCTKTAEIYSTEVGVMMDLPGYDDTDLEYLPDDIAELASVKLAEVGVQGIRFLLFDSLADSTIQLRTSVAQLVAAYGSRIKNSIIVIASKKDRADDDELDGRIEELKTTMSDLGIGKELVTWQNKKIDDNAFRAQVMLLKQAISRVDVVTTDQLEDLNDRVDKRAIELHEKQVPELQKKIISVEESYVEEWEEEEPYTEQHVELENYTEIYSDEEHYYEKTGEWNPVGKAFAAIGSLGITAAFNVGEGTYKRKTRQVEKTREATRPKIVTRERKKWVTHSETKKRVVDKEITVEVFAPIESFLLQAREEITAEVRKELESKIRS